MMSRDPPDMFRDLSENKVDPDEFGDLAGRAPHPEGGLDWFQLTAATTSTQGERFRLAIARSAGGAPTSLLPLRIHPVRWTIRRAAGLASPYTTRFQAPLGAPEDARALALQLDHAPVDVLHLEALDREDMSVSALVEALQEIGWAVRWHEHFVEWSEDIDDFDRYLAARPSALRSTLRRKRLRLLRDHRAAMRIVSGADPAEKRADAAAAYEAAHLASWKKPEPFPRFLPGLIEVAARNGTLRLSTLEVEGRAVAAQIWLTQGGAATLFKLAHHSAFDHLSVGSVLTAMTIEQLVAHDAVTQISFGRGEDAYKRLWASRRAMRWGVSAVRPGLRTIGEALRWVWGPAWRRRLRQE